MSLYGFIEFGEADLGNIILNKSTTSLHFPCAMVNMTKEQIAFSQPAIIKETDIVPIMNGSPLYGDQTYTFGPMIQNRTVLVNNTTTSNTLAFSNDELNYYGLTTSFTGSGQMTNALFNGSMWVAITSDISQNNIAYSYDGITWTIQSNAIATGYFSLCWFNNMWLVGGNNSTGASIIYSYDGINWIGIANTATLIQRVYSIQYNGHILMASGSNTANTVSALAYSFDGLTWTNSGTTSLRTLMTGAIYKTVWNGSLWVAVGQGTNALAYTMDPFGLTGWIGLGTASVSNFVYDCVWNGTIFVAVGTSSAFSSTVYYSFNGISWKTTTNRFGSSARSVTWTGTKFIVGGPNGSSSLAYSYNGIHWFSITNTLFGSPVNSISAKFNSLRPHSITFQRNMVLAGCSISGNTIAYSFDGLNWTGINEPTFAGNINTLVYNGRIWVCGSFDSGNTLATSTNGLKWNGLGTAFFSQSCNSIVWSSTNSMWVAGGGGTNTIGYSYDGLTWIPVISPLSVCYGVATYNGKFVAVGGYTGNTIANSTDGINWTGIGTQVLSNGGLSVATNGTLWVAVGQNANKTGSIVYSADMITWIETNNTIFSNIVNWIAWNGFMWVAVGIGTYSTAYSYDGLTWYVGTNIFELGGENVVWNGTVWIASGLASSTRSMAYSNDGIIWSTISSSAFLYAYGLGSNYGVQPKPYIQHPTLAFGSLGSGFNTMIYSPDGINWIGLGSNIFTTSARHAFWNGKMWVAVGQGTNSLAYSYDGISWTGLGTRIFTQGLDVCYNGKIWVAVGQGALHTIGYSTDGITWRGVDRSTTIFTTNGIGITWNGSVFLASGIGGNSMATSLDGINWSGVSSTRSYTSVGYCATNGVLTVAPVASSIGLIYTTDITCQTGWTAVTSSPFTTSGNCVVWNGLIWVAGGSGATFNLAYSRNGISWTGVSFPAAVLDMCWTGSRFVAITATLVGYSTDGITWVSNTSLFTTQGLGVASNSGIGAFVAPSALNLSLYGPSGTQTLDVIASDPYCQTGFDNVSIYVTPTYPSMYSSYWNFKTSVANNPAGNIDNTTFAATGNVSVAVINRNTVVSFLSGTGSIEFSKNIQVNALVVGGGGAGGYQPQFTYGGGAGGGGGSVGFGTLPLYASQTYNLSVGVGGIAGSIANLAFTNGGNSSITGMNILEYAYGGGTGGSGIVNYQPGSNGGSGGGGNGDGWTNPGGSALDGFGKLTYLGNQGGTGIWASNGQYGSGGGGAMVAGQDGTSVSGTGIGGNGYTWGYTMTAYGGGGGGGAMQTNNFLGGIGGTGGGGSGGNYISILSRKGQPGTPNTGGGGGGGGAGGSDGGNGGSGIISFAFQSPTIVSPTNGLGFFLTFPSNTIPVTDAYSNVLTINGNIGIINDDTRGNVLTTTNGNSSISTTYATPVSFSRCFWYRPIIYNLYNNTVSTLSLPLAYNGTGVLNAVFGFPNSPVPVTDNYPRGLYSWNHYALTYNSSTTMATLYTNGYQVAKQADIIYEGDAGVLNNGGLCIGDYNGTGQGAVAYYDRIRSYNRELSALEVAAIFSEEYLAARIPTENLTFSLSFGSATMPTMDAYGSTLTVNGTVSMYNYVRGFVADMSGNASSFSTNYATPDSFTRAFWYNPLLFSGQMNTVSSRNLKMHFNNTNFMTAAFNVVSGTPVSLTDTVNRGANTWTHYALTYRAVTQTAVLYVNGSAVVQSTSVVYAGESGNLNAGGLCIGDYNATGIGAVNTRVFFDKIHGYNTALSASQIATIYVSEFISSGTTFSLSFGSSTVPIIDDFGSTVVNIGGVSMVNDPQTGFVPYMSSVNSSFSTNFATASTFSRCFWYKPTTITGSMNTLSSRNLQMHFNSTAFMRATFNVVSGTPVSLIDTVARSANTWTHYALTYSGTTARLYVNGVQVAQNTSVTYTGESGSLNNGGLCIGDYNGTGFGSVAYFENIRCFNRAISAEEVLNLYNAEYIAPAFSTVGLTFSLAFGSASVPTTDSFGNALTNNNSVTMVNENTRGFVAYMGAINRSFSTTYATPASFTRAFWYLPTAISGAMNTVSSRNLKMHFNSTNFMTAAFNVVSGTPVSIADTTNRGTTNWTHYALTYNAVSRTARLYVNGVQVVQNTNVTYAGETGTLNSGGLCIGDYNATGIGSVSYFDQVHCYNRELSAVEVSALYSFEFITAPLNITASNVTTNTMAAGYRILDFRNNGSITLTSIPTTTFLYFIVAGGGGGGRGILINSPFGRCSGGGGGGGGVLQNSFSISGSTTITITVGGGGAGVARTAQSTTNGVNGGNSIIQYSGTTITALGGGGGGSGLTDGNNSLLRYSGANGGSGGGGAAGGGTGTSGQGKNGASVVAYGGTNTFFGGGGGGAVADAIPTIFEKQNGGAGIQCTLPGISSYTTDFWAGGGGGGGRDGATSGNGGTGGGGNGGSGSFNPGGNGSNGGGGGGGASLNNAGDTGGNGGSGAVIVAYNISGALPSFSNFNLSFSSRVIPTVDLCGNQIVTVGNVTMVNDSVRGNVAFMSTSFQSFSTNYATPTAFTRAFWYKPISINGQNNTLSTRNLKMHFNNTNFMTASFNVVSGTPVSLTDTIIRGTNTWTHYALTYSGTTATLYVNGASVATNSSVSYTGENSNLNAGALCIGDYNATGLGATSGAYFDKIYSFNTAYTAGQITALFNSENIAAPVPANGLTLSLTFDSGIVPTTDAYSNTFSTRGNVSIRQDQVRGNVLYMSDIGSSLFTNYSTPTSFSRCFWHNISSTSYGIHPANTVSSLKLPIWFGSPATNLLRASFNFTTTPVLVTDISARGFATWVHYAITYSGTTATLYVDGVSRATATVTYTGDTSMAIGDYTTSGSGAIASFDQIHCYNRALTASEVLSIYTAEFISPTILISNGTLTGWTTNGSITSSSSFGNPAPSIYSTGGFGSQYAYVNLANYSPGLTNMNGSILQFDIYTPTNSIIDVYFGCTVSGAGQMWRLETRSGGSSGIANTNSWTSWGGPSSGPVLLANTWYTIRITISSVGVATYTYNGTAGTQSYTIANNNGTFIGLQGDSLSGGYWDNVLFTRL